MTVRVKKKNRWKKAMPIYLLMLPGILYLLINNYLPMFGIIIAFKNMNYRKGIWGSDWCGLDNFKFLFTVGDTAYTMLRNTILYNIVFIILGIVIPMTMAILLNEIRSKFTSRFYQTVILLPYLMSMVVVSYLVYAFLSADTGYINNTVFQWLGIDKKISFYQEKKYWPFILVFVNQWKSLGFGLVIYLSSILGISPEYYEAAKIDGANKWQQIKFITLPTLKPTVITLFILNISKIFCSDFGLFYQVPKNSGALYSVTQTIDTYVYNALMVQNNIGMSSAASVFQSVVGCVLVIVANKIVSKIDAENAMF